MWLRFTFACRLLFMNHTNNFFFAQFSFLICEILSTWISRLHSLLWCIVIYTRKNKFYKISVPRNHSPLLFIRGWQLNKNKKQKKNHVFLSGYVLSQSYKGVIIIIIILLFFYYWLGWGGGGCFNRLHIFLSWWIDKGISPKCLLLHITQHFLHVSEKPPFQDSVYKRIQFIVPSKCSSELKHRFIMYSIQVGFTENADKNISIDNIRIEYK